ncbi:hypothetical protein SRHO_G00091820 [Serrasalmus rhombeus]
MRSNVTAFMTTCPESGGSSLLHRPTRHPTPATRPRTAHGSCVFTAQRAGAEQPALRGGVATLSCCRWGSARVRAGRTVRLSQVSLPHLLMSLQLPL